MQSLFRAARIHLPDWCQEGVVIEVLSLQESGIPVPNHICVNRDDLAEGQDPEGFVETEDYVEVNGELLWAQHVLSLRTFLFKPAFACWWHA